MKEVIAMILAGGRGKRMGVLCSLRPKPLLPFGSKFRIIDFTLSNCVNSGLRDVAMLSSYRYEQIVDYMHAWTSVNQGKLDLKLLNSGKIPYRGTADALYQNIQYLRQNPSETVLILSADHVYNMDYRAIVEYHRNSGCEATIAVMPVPMSKANMFGIVETDNLSRIRNFMEKPLIPGGNLASMGIYIFNKNILLDCLDRDASEKGSAHDFGYSILPRLISDYNVSAFQYSGYWQDVGTPDTYFEANMEYIHGSTFKGNCEWPLLTAPPVNHGINIYGYDNAANSIIGSGCVIKGRVENSILSPGVWVEDRAIVRDSILLPNVFVGYHSMIENAIIDEGSHISKYSFVGFKTGSAEINSQITILGREVIIPPFTAVLQNTRISPYSTIENSRAVLTLDKVSALTHLFRNEAYSQMLLSS